MDSDFGSLLDTILIPETVYFYPIAIHLLSNYYPIAIQSVNPSSSCQDRVSKDTIQLLSNHIDIRTRRSQKRSIYINRIQSIQKLGLVFSADVCSLIRQFHSFTLNVNSLRCGLIVCVNIEPYGFVIVLLIECIHNDQTKDLGREYVFYDDRFDSDAYEEDAYT